MSLFGLVAAANTCKAVASRSDSTDEAPAAEAHVVDAHVAEADAPTHRASTKTKGSTIALPSARTRLRSPDADHMSRHTQQFGTPAAARKRCNRCLWIHKKDAWKESCLFVMADGTQTTWLQEEPSRLSPWGLGCSLCRAFVEGTQAKPTIWSQCLYGSRDGKLQVEDLLRHGNASASQQSAKRALDQGHCLALEHYMRLHCAQQMNDTHQDDESCGRDDVPSVLQYALAHETVKGLHVRRTYAEFCDVARRAGVSHL